MDGSVELLFVQNFPAIDLAVVNAAADDEWKFAMDGSVELLFGGKIPTVDVGVAYPAEAGGE